MRGAKFAVSEETFVKNVTKAEGTVYMGHQSLLMKDMSRKDLLFCMGELLFEIEHMRETHRRDLRVLAGGVR